MIELICNILSYPLTNLKTKIPDTKIQNKTLLLQYKIVL